MATKPASITPQRTWLVRIAFRILQIMRGNSFLNYPLEPILQTSSTRLRTIAIFMVVAQPLTFIIWSIAVPQPFDNIWLRMILSLLPTIILAKKIYTNPNSELTELICSLIFWIELPVFFFFMYLANGGNNEWLVSICCMMLIYYHIVDWRIATIGIAAGFFFAKTSQMAFEFYLPAVETPPMASHSMLVGFCWLASLALGASAANMRREHIRHIKDTVMIIANNLRTSLTVAHNISTKLLDEAALECTRSPSEFAAKVDRLASRLISTTKMTTDILDTQIVNAGIQHATLDKGETAISALELANEVFGGFPFELPSDRLGVRIVANCDFTFVGSFRQFSQVLSNILNNSLSAVHQSRREMSPGDIQLIIEKDDANNGQIRIIDHGVGIPDEIIKKVFDPLFTTKFGGLGLGLTYCKMVVEAAGGSIRVESVQHFRQTVVVIRLPIHASVTGGFPYVSYGGVSI